MAEIKTICQLCNKKFITSRPTAKYCLDCRYSRLRYEKNKYRTDVVRNKEAFLRLFNSWIPKLEKKDVELIKHSLLTKDL